MLGLVQVRDWYVESFAELRSFPPIKDAVDEAKFTELLKQIYQRHRSPHHPPRDTPLMCMFRLIEQPHGSQTNE